MQEILNEHDTKKPLPVVVDLDGTLVFADMLMENLFLFLKAYPWRFFQVFWWLVRGKAFLKCRLADVCVPVVENMPYNEKLLTWLKERHAAGTRLFLATASEQKIADRVAAHLGIFEQAFGTTEGKNLSAKKKRDFLLKFFVPDGFEYVGNSRDDLPVWEAAAIAHVVRPSRRLLGKITHKLGSADVVFDDRPPYVKALLKSLRIHQWAKNSLVFVPLIAAHKLQEPRLVGLCFLAFMAFGLCASSVYVLNDLFDLGDDRNHPSKRLRPIAAGEMPITHAALLVPVLLIISFGISLSLLPSVFTVFLISYYLLTLSYTLYFKRIPMLDVIVLAIFYTLRVMAGAAGISVVLTPWLLAFSMFIFLSLAFVKRYTELAGLSENSAGKQNIGGKGYWPEDLSLLLTLGGSSGYTSVLILALYINAPITISEYHSPEFLWLACPILIFWLNRVWLLTHRGKMHDDPVIFALTDKVSLLMGLMLFCVFLVASFL